MTGRLQRTDRDPGVPRAIQLRFEAFSSSAAVWLLECERSMELEGLSTQEHLQALEGRLEAEAFERASAVAHLGVVIEEAVSTLTRKLEAQAPKELPKAWSGLEELRRSVTRLTEQQQQQEERLRALAHKVDQLQGTQAILDRDQKAPKVILPWSLGRGHVPRSLQQDHGA